MFVRGAASYANSVIRTPCTSSPWPPPPPTRTQRAYDSPGYARHSRDSFDIAWGAGPALATMFTDDQGIGSSGARAFERTTAIMPFRLPQPWSDQLQMSRAKRTPGEKRRSFQWTAGQSPYGPDQLLPVMRIPESRCTSAVAARTLLDAVAK